MRIEIHSHELWLGLFVFSFCCLLGFFLDLKKWLLKKLFLRKGGLLLAGSLAPGMAVPQVKPRMGGLIKAKLPFARKGFVYIEIAFLHQELDLTNDNINNEQNDDTDDIEAD